MHSLQDYWAWGRRAVDAVNFRTVRLRLPSLSAVEPFVACACWCRMTPAAGEHWEAPWTAPAFPHALPPASKSYFQAHTGNDGSRQSDPCPSCWTTESSFYLLIRTEKHCFLLFGGIRHISRNHPTVLLETILYLFLKMSLHLLHSN